MVVSERDSMMDLEGPHAYCMFISIELLPLDMMSADVHSMMMSANARECQCAQIRVFMRRMTLWSFADLRTPLQISLTKGSRGCASTLGIHTHTCESCVVK